jgi:hypothetical protein
MWARNRALTFENFMLHMHFILHITFTFSQHWREGISKAKEQLTESAKEMSTFFEEQRKEEEKRREKRTKMGKHEQKKN